MGHGALFLDRFLASVWLDSMTAESSGQQLRAVFLEFSDNPVRVVDAAGPDAPAGLHKSRPEARVIGQIGMRPQIRARIARGEFACAFLWTEQSGRIAHQVNG